MWTIILTILFALFILFALYLTLRNTTNLFRSKKTGKNYRLDWTESPEDERDFRFSDLQKKRTLTAAPPKSVNLSDRLPEVYDQGNIGSCTGNSCSSIGLHQSRVQNREIYPSRLFLYYGARELINETDVDGGAHLRDVFKSWNKKGVASEMTWPYNEGRVLERPSDQAYHEAAKTLATAYYTLDNRNLSELKSCLASGHPFVFGFWVYDSFFGSWRDTMPIPNTSKERFLGGHAVTAIGYDDGRQAFLIKNSWGTDWKDNGHFWMPYAFITNRSFCVDFWMLEGITPGEAPAPTPDNKTTVVDLRSVFFDKRGLCRLREDEIVRMGQRMGLNTHVDKRKTENVEIVAGGLGIQ